MFYLLMFIKLLKIPFLKINLKIKNKITVIVDLNLMLRYLKCSGYLNNPYKYITEDINNNNLHVH